MKIRTKTFGALATVAMVGGLLVATVGTASSTHGGEGVLGRLDLFANSTDGDGFEFTPEDPTGAVLTEVFTEGSRGRIEESDSPDLVNLAATGPGSPSQVYPSIKDHQVGVKAQGEGVGTPLSLINDATTETQVGQTLEIAIGADSPRPFAWYAELSFKSKFGVTVQVDAYDVSGNLILTEQVPCGPDNDCGPDSGDDLITVPIGNHDASTVFSSVVISIASPEDGAVGLIDDEGFDTFFEIPDIDGVLGCNDAVQEEDGGLSGEFIRLNTTEEVVEGCNNLKVYNLATIAGAEHEIRFEPDAGVVAAYRGDLIFPTDPANPTTASLRYDKDGDGIMYDFVLTQWCDFVPVPAGENWHRYPSDHPTHPNELYFPELAGLGDLGEDLFPTLETLGPDSDGGDPTSCNVALINVGGGEEHWVEYLEEDPFYI